MKLINSNPYAKNNSHHVTTRFVFFALKIKPIRPSKLKDSIEDSMKTFYCSLRPSYISCCTDRCITSEKVYVL